MTMKTNILPMLGETIVEISGLYKGSECATFKCASGRVFAMSHDPGSYSNVSIDDIVGDIESLLHKPLLMAEEVNNVGEDPKDESDSYTWTFYKFATVLGYVTIKWYGTSNGYYSEAVDFEELTA